MHPETQVVVDPLEQLRSAVGERYRIERELGRGGMATVYLAEDVKHHRRVALKVLGSEIAMALGPERFLREIETTASLRHPNILPLYDSGAADGILYYVMPYVEGESLRDRLGREKQLPLDDALQITREVADALSYAHARGLLHRDIKPENILLESGHAVVADFGIARAIDAAGGPTLTRTGVALGTPAYMSPEQSAGSPELDGRSDLYSLGCVLFEMLAGQPPFTGATAESLAYQHMSVAAPLVTQMRSTVPEAIGGAIQRTLAKAAADRFSSASELAAALAPVQQPAMSGRGEGPARRHARAIAVTVGAVIIALLAVAVGLRWGPFSRGLGGAGTVHPTKKDWILVAEFDGPADDSSLTAATRNLVSAALDQSEIVAAVPRDQIQLALHNAGKPESTRVDEALARELAYRSSVRAVVSGKVDRLGTGYSVVVRVVDADSGKVLLTETAVAKNQDALIPALGRLAQKLRAGLGENRSAIQATRPMGEIATPSFEAYRLFVRAFHLQSALSMQQAAAVCRDALALDPDFALAWQGLGVDLGNLRQVDSSLAAYDQALRRPQRMTTVQRLFTEALRETGIGDLTAALATYDRVLQYEPGDQGALNNRGLILNSLGHYQKSLESIRSAERASAFGALPLHRANEVWNLIYLGRLDEAREVSRYLSGDAAMEYRTWIALAATDWALAESLATARAESPGLPADARALALLHLASAQAGRGALRAAGATLERAEAMTRAKPELVTYLDLARRARLALAVVSRGVVLQPEDSWTQDTTTASLVTRGLRAAIEGDRAAALRLLNAARTRPPRELAAQGAAPALLEAWIAAIDGQWGETVQLLQPLARQPAEIGQIDYPAGLSMARWLLADAFEKLGQPDSAAVYLEKVTSGPQSDPTEGQFVRGATWSLTHHRLVMLYARMGNLEGAQRHWRILSETVRTPDPEVQTLLAEARAAVAGAEGMGRSTRR